MVVLADGETGIDLGEAISAHASEVIDLGSRQDGPGADPLGREVDPGGVVAVLSTGAATALAASTLARRLGLRGHDDEAVRRAGDRSRVRRALFAAGIPHPEYRLLTPGQDPGHEARLVGLPAEVRPVATVGGGGRRPVETAADVREAVAALGGLGRGLLVERALEGRWLTALVWTRAGRVVTEVVLEGRLDAEPTEPAARVPPQASELAAQVPSALELRDGPLTVELCVDDRFVRIVEVLPAHPRHLTGRPVVGGRTPEAVSLGLALG